MTAVSEQESPFRLDDEQRARVKDCLKKAAVSLPHDRLERFVGSIEASIARFRATPPEASFRDAHDALRALWALAHEDDPAIGQLKGRLARLPAAARESIGWRAPIVLQQLLGVDLGSPVGELQKQVFDRFLAWTKMPEAVQRPEPPPPPPKALTERIVTLAGTELTEPVSPPPLVMALRVLTSSGARPVKGRSRGGGKRSGPRWEPIIMGEVRGAGTARHHSGRPTSDRTLVMHLALDWLTETGQPPKPGRSDNTGFGDLVHSVFQWLELPDSATNALRGYWDIVKKRKALEPIQDFLRRHSEESDRGVASGFRQ